MNTNNLRTFINKGIRLNGQGHADLLKIRVLETEGKFYHLIFSDMGLSIMEKQSTRPAIQIGIVMHGSVDEMMDNLLLALPDIIKDPLIMGEEEKFKDFLTTTLVSQAAYLKTTRYPNETADEYNERIGKMDRALSTVI